MTGHYVGTLLNYLAAADVSVADLAALKFGYFRLLQQNREPLPLTGLSPRTLPCSLISFNARSGVQTSRAVGARARIR